MTPRNTFIGTALLAATILTPPAFAADVTPERLLNPDREPQNWLMNHRTYDGQRFSPLTRINKDNVKNLGSPMRSRSAASAATNGTKRRRWSRTAFSTSPTPGACSTRSTAPSGDVGRIVWRMDPKQEKQGTNRGAAFWGNLVISPANWPARIVATDKETGKVVWETNMVFGQAETRITAAPLAVKDKIIVGASGGDSGVRDWIAALDAATGNVLWRKFTIPAPGEPGSETWKGANNAWQTGGGAVWVTGTYDPDTNQTIWGTGNPVPMFDPFYRPGRQSLHQQRDFLGSRSTGKMNWYFQYTPGDMWDYDEVGTHILIDGEVAGQPRKLITHSARNGFLYTMDRSNGTMVGAKPYMDNVNWTKGIDQKTGKPLDYDPDKDIQTYAGVGNLTPDAPLKKVCPSIARRQQLLAVVLQPQHQAHLHPGHDGVRRRSRSTATSTTPQRGWNGGLFTTDERFESNLTAIDPVTGEIKKNVAPAVPELFGHARDRRRAGVPRPARRHARGLRRHHARRVVEDQCRHRLHGAADDLRGQRQAIRGDHVGAERGVARPSSMNTPELKEMRNATVLYVFAL